MRAICRVAGCVLAGAILTAVSVPEAAAQRKAANDRWEHTATAQTAWRSREQLRTLDLLGAHADTVSTQVQTLSVRERRHNFARTMTYIGGATGAVIMVRKGQKRGGASGLHLITGFFMGAFPGAIVGDVLGRAFIHDDDSQIPSNSNAGDRRY